MVVTAALIGGSIRAAAVFRARPADQPRFYFFQRPKTRARREPSEKRSTEAESDAPIPDGAAKTSSTRGPGCRLPSPLHESPTTSRNLRQQGQRNPKHAAGSAVTAGIPKLCSPRRGRAGPRHHELTHVRKKPRNPDSSRFIRGLGDLPSFGAPPPTLGHMLIVGSATDDWTTSPLGGPGSPRSGMVDFSWRRFLASIISWPSSSQSARRVRGPNDDPRSLGAEKNLRATRSRWRGEERSLSLEASGGRRDGRWQVNQAAQAALHASGPSRVEHRGAFLLPTHPPIEEAGPQASSDGVLLCKDASEGLGLSGLTKPAGRGGDSWRQPRRFFFCSHTSAGGVRYTFFLKR